MYAYIKGELTEKTTDCAVVEANGVGYQLICPTSTLSTLGETGTTVKVHTYLYIREDVMQLYGFATKSERDMFLRLLSVSGIGPKVATAVLSGLSVTQLAVALVTDDVRSLSNIPGIGKKTAQRLILELKEKVSNDELKGSDGVKPPTKLDPFEASARQEALHALIALGIRQAEAMRAVDAVDDPELSAEQLITKALRTLDGRR